MSEQLNDHSQRAHALLSASSSARWLACPPSAVAADAYPDQDTEFTREGTWAHEAAEAVVRARTLGRDLSRFIWPADITPEMVEHAQGFADYIQELVTVPNPIILVEQKVDYSPWAPDGFGTCDVILIQADTLTIIDYKYGQGVPVSAEGNPQMRLYALGALNDYGIALEVTNVEAHIYQPRLDSISVERLTVDELLAWGETVKPRAALAAEGKGDYAAGAWCKFCPHAGRCRELTAACSQMIETHGLRHTLPVLAPHEVAEVLAMEAQVTMWLKRVKAQALETLLDGGEVPGWKVVEGKQGNRKWADELKAAAILKDAGYSQEEYTETKLLSPAAMDKALGKKRAKELLADLIDRSPGAPTVVPHTDKRPAYDRVAEAQKDFI